jgi:hypothetical protein
MKIKNALPILALLTLCSCGKQQPTPSGNAAVSQIHAGGGYTFLIKDTGKPLSMGSGNGDDTNNELWLVNDATGEKRLLVGCRDAKEMENEICDIQNPQLSPDKSNVYFESSAWATSGAIHVVDLKSGNEKFLCPGNGLQVIDSGKYKGDIITNMHKYNKGDEGGSYDHFFVVDPTGKEMKDLGEELDKSKLN